MICEVRVTRRLKGVRKSAVQRGIKVREKIGGKKVKKCTRWKE